LWYKEARAAIAYVFRLSGLGREPQESARLDRRGCGRSFELGLKILGFECEGGGDEAARYFRVCGVYLGYGSQCYQVFQDSGQQPWTIP
jgi:hypothetical protein